MTEVAFNFKRSGAFINLGMMMSNSWFLVTPLGAQMSLPRVASNAACMYPLQKPIHS